MPSALLPLTMTQFMFAVVVQVVSAKSAAAAQIFGIASPNEIAPILSVHPGVSLHKTVLIQAEMSVINHSAGSTCPHASRLRLILQTHSSASQVDNEHVPRHRNFWR